MKKVCEKYSQHTLSREINLFRFNITNLNCSIIFLNASFYKQYRFFFLHLGWLEIRGIFFSLFSNFYSSLGMRNCKWNLPSLLFIQNIVSSKCIASYAYPFPKLQTDTYFSFFIVLNNFHCNDNIRTQI